MSLFYSLRYRSGSSFTPPQELGLRFTSLISFSPKPEHILWIYSEEKGDWARPEELSGGAVDEFYLACRFALVRLIYGEIRPPLVLDDPFVNFDELRLVRTLEFLSKLSKEHQIIIFTLREAYDSIADRVIELT